MNFAYAVFAITWTLAALACAIVLPASWFLIPALICVGMALYSIGRSVQS